ncbi:uncharacterized protein PG998_000880 [Apiospora kogelbergensis]|uniref:uncharacterized protein n=1 Tax=Apiospora kogelbergensis TaxID=1337665 RepID=UPI0031309CDC
MPEHQGPPSTQGAAPSPNNAVRQQDKPDIASIWSDSSTVWSSHDRVDSQVPPRLFFPAERILGAKVQKCLFRRRQAAYRQIRQRTWYQAQDARHRRHNEPPTQNLSALGMWTRMRFMGLAARKGPPSPMSMNVGAGF